MKSHSETGEALLRRRDLHGYEPPNPRSWRCRLGLHRGTVVPPEYVASLAECGVYRPGAVTADKNPWPGGWAGPKTFEWCVRCGASTEPEREAAARAEARATLTRIVREAREKHGLCPDCYSPHPIGEPHTDDAEVVDV